MDVVELPWLLVAGHRAAGRLRPAAAPRASRSARARLARLGTLDVVRRLVPASAFSTAAGWRAARLGAAALLAGIALAGPRWGVERTTVRSTRHRHGARARRVALDAGHRRAAEPAGADEAGDSPAARAVARRPRRPARVRRPELRALAAHGRRRRARPLPRQSRSVRRRTGGQLDRADDRAGNEPARTHEEWRRSCARHHERWRGVRAAGRDRSRARRAARGRASVWSPSASARRRARRFR